MERPRLVFASIVSLALTACAAERPPVDDGLDEDGPTSVEDELVIGARPSTDAPEPPVPAVEQCAPGDVRECRITYYDVYGRKHCPTAVQYCQPSGLGWMPCGAPPEPVSSGKPS